MKVLRQGFLQMCGLAGHEWPDVFSNEPFAQNISHIQSKREVLFLDEIFYVDEGLHIAGTVCGKYHIGRVSPRCEFSYAPLNST